MHRIIFCITIAVSVATIAPAAPVPTHLMPSVPPLAIPTKLGTTWVYDHDGEEKTLVISRSEEVETGRLVTTEWLGADGTRTPYWVMSVTKDDVRLVAQLGEMNDAPWCFIKLPHRSGKTWEVRFSHSGREFKGMIAARPMERIKVPAGEFSAARIDCVFISEGWVDELKVTCWFAHGVGLVQMDENRKLKSFTPGKD